MGKELQVPTTTMLQPVPFFFFFFKNLTIDSYVILFPKRKNVSFVSCSHFFLVLCSLTSYLWYIWNFCSVFFWDRRNLKKKKKEKTPWLEGGPIAHLPTAALSIWKLLLEGREFPLGKQTPALKHILKVTCVSYNKNSSSGIKDVFNDCFLDNFVSPVGLRE